MPKRSLNTERRPFVDFNVSIFHFGREYVMLNWLAGQVVGIRVCDHDGKEERFSGVFLLVERD